MTLPADRKDNIVQFKDGPTPLPEWQLPFVAGLKTETMNHAEFVSKLNGMMLRNATADAVETHMRGSVLARGLLHHGGRRT